MIMYLTVNDYDMNHKNIFRTEAEGMVYLLFNDRTAILSMASGIWINPEFLSLSLSLSLSHTHTHTHTQHIV